MPRICFLVDRFLPLEGGQEIHAFQLSECLIKKGSAVTIVTRQMDPRTPLREQMEGMQVVRLLPSGMTKGKGWRAFVPTLAFLLRVFRYVLQEARNYDLILVSGFKLMTGVAVLISTITGKPCVVRPESPLDVSEPISVNSLRSMRLAPGSLPVRVIQRLQRFIARRANHMVAISGEIREKLLEAGIDQGKIESIPNGIDLARFSPVSPSRKHQIRTVLKLPQHRCLVTYTGRVAHSKGVMALIEVWRQIHAKFPETELVIVGSGSNVFDSCEAELRQYIADHDLSGCVTLAGTVNNVHEYLQASDVFVFPSDYEGFGLSIVEAMAVGLPIVTTRVGVAADIVLDGVSGVLVRPGIRQDLFEGMQRVIADRSLQASMGERAQLAARANYGMSAVADRYLELFSRVLGAGPNSRILGTRAAVKGGRGN